ATDLDAMVERSDDGTYLLTRLEPIEVDLGPVAAPIEVSAAIPPRLDAEAAARRLETTGARQLLFVDPETGRGSVIYHRYDRHYGLITPRGPSGPRCPRTASRHRGHGDGPGPEQGPGPSSLVASHSPGDGDGARLRRPARDRKPRTGSRSASGPGVAPVRRR